MSSGHRPLLLDMDGDKFDDLLVYEPGHAHGADYIVPGGPGKDDPLKGNFQQEATYIPLGGDFDGDGYDDLFWYGPGTTADQIWFGGPTSSSPWRTKTLSISGSYRPAVGDFNGDGYDDVFWHGPGSTVGDSIWSFGPGGTLQGVQLRRLGHLQARRRGLRRQRVRRHPPLRPRQRRRQLLDVRKGRHPHQQSHLDHRHLPTATGDFDGDGYDDLMWYAPGTSKDSMWWGSTTGAKPG